MEEEAPAITSAQATPTDVLLNILGHLVRAQAAADCWPSLQTRNWDGAWRLGAVYMSFCGWLSLLVELEWIVLQGPIEVLQAALVNKHWCAVALSKDAWARRVHSTLPQSCTASLEGGTHSWPSLWHMLKPANLLPPLDCAERQTPGAGFQAYTAALKPWTGRGTSLLSESGLILAWLHQLTPSIRSVSGIGALPLAIEGR